MSEENPVIAVDMLGGDDEKHKPGEIETEAIKSLKRKHLFGGKGISDNTLLKLVGDKDQIEEGLRNISKDGIEIIHKPDRLSNKSKLEDIQEKTEASILECFKLLHTGKVDAVVSAGSSVIIGGAAMIFKENGKTKSKAMKVKEERFIPAFAVTAPNPGFDDFTVLLDLGFRVTRDHKKLTKSLINNALLGIAFWKTECQRLGKNGDKKPRVRILSNGEELGKAPEDIKEAVEKLKSMESVDFAGLIEANHIFGKGKDADIVVTDGFTGNLILKTIEGTLLMVRDVIAKDAKRNPLTTIWALLRKKLFKTIHPDEHAGALVLGVDGIVVKSHGSSKPGAIETVIKRAESSVKLGCKEKMIKELEGLL